MDLEEIGINAGNWVDSAQDRDYLKAFVNAALNLRVPQAMELVNKQEVDSNVEPGKITKQIKKFYKIAS